jgi:hypothetical protein
MWLMHVFWVGVGVTVCGCAPMHAVTLGDVIDDLYSYP